MRRHSKGNDTAAFVLQKYGSQTQIYNAANLLSKMTQHAFLFPLASSAVYVTSVVPLKTCGRLTARREIVICGAKLLMSSEMGVLQFTKAV